MRPAITFIILVAITLIATTAAWAEEPQPRGLSSVPFTDVKVQDEFWAPRLETNRERSLPHNLKWCEQTGRIPSSRTYSDTCQNTTDKKTTLPPIRGLFETRGNCH